MTIAVNRVGARMLSASMFCVLAALLLLLPACQRNAPVQTTKAAAAKSDKPLAVVDIQAGKSIALVTAASPPQTPNLMSDPIIVAIHTEGTTAGADLAVKLFSLDRGVIAGMQTNHLNAASEPVQTFIFKPTPKWTPGRYLVEVTLDKKLAGHREVEIFGR